MSDKEKELLLAFLKSRGYRGMYGGKYYFFSGSSTTSLNVLFSNLDLPKALSEEDELARVFVKFKSIKSEIAEVLAVEKYIPETSQGITQDMGGLSMLNCSFPRDLVKKDVVLMKTIRKDGINDSNTSRSGGLSILAYNTKSGMMLDTGKVSIDGLLTLFGITREEVVQNENIPVVWPVFNPYTSELVFDHVEPSLSNEPIKVLNTATPPRWMTHASPGVGPAYTGFIKTLIEHLFPEQEDRERVLDWVHYAIFKRNGTVLCLAGARGTGKSTFVEILGHLVGNHYSEIVNEAILEDKFNAQFHNKRLIIFEEVALNDSKAINKVKAWCNKQIAIEEKGQDAYKAENFTSMVFLLNRLDELKIQPQERRFSIPVVAEDNLLTVISEKEIDKFKIGMEEGRQDVVDAIAEFGMFIKNRKPKFSEHLPIRGKNFDRVAELTLTEWQAMLKEHLRQNGEIGVAIPITAIFQPPRASDKETIKFPTKKSTIEGFLMDYRIEGKYNIGKVVDIKPDEMEALEESLGIVRSRPGKNKRYYGIIPDEQFLKKFGVKYNRAEDLL